jgi:Protein of unknown function (DUF1553)/Protein of unknown function (DUF1549)
MDSGQTPGRVNRREKDEPEMKQNKISALCGGALLLAGFLVSPAQEVNEPSPPEPPETGAAVVEHPECSYFLHRDKFKSVLPGSATGQQYGRSALTEQVMKLMSAAPSAQSARSAAVADSAGTIDKYLFAEMQAQGVTPADKTTDLEFIRRVTLDLTGRIPAPDRVLSFVADTTPDKRARLIDELLAKPEWIDKWTMYFGDLYKNAAFKTFVNIYEPGRNALYKWIKDSLTANKPYNKMATELISSAGENSYTQGELNWLVGAWVIGNPQQDNIDQEAANVAETFLGISHMNCLLCHNGRGHLDALSLWGASTARMTAWGFSSFLSHATTTRVPLPTAVNNTPYYWTLRDDPPRITDYTLNTTTGNRPARQPIGTQRTVPPVYPFNGETPAPGENYRLALARIVTSDIQFARATVNYLWKEFFGRGIVDPVNQFDPARLDPDNPPPDPWTLQPSNARLLNAMAQEFVDDGFNLKTLMRKIANSDAYQLSSRYNGDWKPEYEPLFARKLVRRLWAEEIHDAVVQATGVLPNNGAGYNMANYSSFPANSPYIGYPVFGNIMWAMQSPDVTRTPDNNGGVSSFLNSFIRGDRDSEDRRGDGSALQALGLMNDNFITSRLNAAVAPANSLLGRNRNAPADQMINNLYLAVLSRYPTADEKATVIKQFRSFDTATVAENLLWSLFNKVDFVFNY